MHTVVIGAGIGGLTAAALLLKAGHRVTVLEAHVYPGGSAGTFYHKGYRFDAGATLAGGFAPGGPHAQIAERLDLSWPVSPVDPAWVVRLPDGRQITQWADAERWRKERQHHFPNAETFWRTQEMLADVAWDVSTRPFPWPPASTADWWALAKAVRPQTLRAAPYLFRSMASFAPDDPLFRSFLDTQLLISAQTTAADANALYGSAALDLPRRGVNHVRGGIGSLARTLVEWIREQGGEVAFRQQVVGIDVDERRKAVAVHTNKGRTVRGDRFVANLTPWALVNLLGEAAPTRLQREVQARQATWGAFTLYLGLQADRLPAGTADHHQVILDANKPLGEGNSVFISLSDPADPGRAPQGMRAATLSTHTAVAPWWTLAEADRSAYLKRRQRYAERLLQAAEQAIPGLRDAVQLCLPGTPLTFDYYTRRPRGMVGGFPQTSLFAARGPGTGIDNLWLVGDSIFPGQSTAGVTLGAMRVAAAVLKTSVD